MKIKLLFFTILCALLLLFNRGNAQVDAQKADNIIESMGVATQINYASQLNVDLNNNLITY